MCKMETENEDVFPNAENAFRIFIWHTFIEGYDAPEHY